MTSFLFKEFLSFFKRLVPSGIFPSNCPLLILDGHGSHVSLKAIKHTQQFGLNMITLLSHTSHALQPLDVSYFKPFKTSFRKERNNNMVRNNYNELNKATLTTWVNKALDVALSKSNIKSGFQVTGI
jgi:hypothetical protein